MTFSDVNSLRRDIVSIVISLWPLECVELRTVKLATAVASHLQMMLLLPADA